MTAGKDRHLLNFFFMRMKYKEYYYAAKVEDTRKEDGGKEVKLYGWTISDKDGNVLQEATELWDDKDDAEQDARDHIDEYYY